MFSSNQPASASETLDANHPPAAANSDTFQCLVTPTVNTSWATPSSASRFLWWSVDLGQSVFIDQVWVAKSNNGDSSTLTNFDIRIGDTLPSSGTENALAATGMTLPLGTFRACEYIQCMPPATMHTALSCTFDLHLLQSFLVQGSTGPSASPSLPC